MTSEFRQSAGAQSRFAFRRSEPGTVVQAYMMHTTRDNGSHKYPINVLLATLAICVATKSSVRVNEASKIE